MNRSARFAARNSIARAFALAALFLASALSAADDPILERQETMETIGESMKALSAMARGEAAFDAAAVEKNAGTIADSLDHAAGLFPEGTHQGAHETWAKSEIWAQRADFDKTLRSAHEAALALRGVRDEQAYRPALGKLGQNCRTCHDSFRRPKE